MQSLWLDLGDFDVMVVCCCVDQGVWWSIWVQQFLYVVDIRQVQEMKVVFIGGLMLIFCVFGNSILYRLIVRGGYVWGVLIYFLVGYCFE